MSVNRVRGSPDPKFSHIFLPTVVSFRKVTFAFDEGRGTQTVGRHPPPPGGRCFPFAGATSLYQGCIYFEQNVDAREPIYFGRHFAGLKYLLYLLLLVPVLAPNDKQQVLSPVKVGKVCYSLAEIYVYLNSFG
jgi:hypothetical protein